MNKFKKGDKVRLINDHKQVMEVEDYQEPLTSEGLLAITFNNEYTPPKKENWTSVICIWDTHLDPPDSDVFEEDELELIL